MDEPPIQWDRIHRRLPDPTTSEQVRRETLELQAVCGERDPGQVNRNAELLLLRVDTLLTNHPSADERSYLLQTAVLLFKIATKAHQRRGRMLRARQLRKAAARLSP